jgi:predicted enzyme related to lactoylglutathione lyase
MSRPVHFDLPADDPERCAQFYREAFGWEIRKWDGPIEYWLVVTGPRDAPGIDGGIGRRSSPDMGVVNTLEVEDLDAALAAVEAASGTVTRPRSALTGVGWLAYCADTEGNPFGLMQPDPMAE